jgi:hypothetical protein
MVRRAERGIGVAVRNGQKAGEIVRSGEGLKQNSIDVPDQYAGEGRNRREGSSRIRANGPKPTR